ncbi:nuclear transport factor 2 family protein [Runella sp.]|uniref:nuclear transport factor 2 family protein n=1 Tax=Runella sp. TaxID=1960881 RepID=UPI003D12E743
MNRFYVLLFALSCFAVSSFAQTDKEQVTSAVGDYVDAFYYGDTARIHRSISPNVVKYGYFKPKNKTAYEGEPMSFREMVDYAARVHKKGLSPNVDKFPKKIEVFDVQDQTAAAKLTAWWGTDYILLAKIDNKWMITQVLWQSPPPKNP